MSTISMDVPTLQANENDLHNLVCFVYKHEQLLKEFGGIKIRPNMECKLALKKRRKNLTLSPVTKQIVKLNKDKLIYSVQKISHMNKSTEQDSLITDENSFWSSLSCSINEQRHLNISVLPNKSFFSQKTSRIYFDIHRLPNQSLLKLGGKKITHQFVPCVRRAHGPGAIFPLTCVQQRLFLIDYHHEGGSRYWYIIPSNQRDVLRRIIDEQDSSLCLDHGQLFINPKLLDKNHIRYYRIIQCPNEFVVLSAGTLAQSFTEDACWSESIAFALPSWIEEGHATVSTPPCQCDISYDFSSKTIDVTLFKHDPMQRYILLHLNPIADNNNMNIITIPTPDSIKTNSSNGIYLSNTIARLT